MAERPAGSGPLDTRGSSSSSHERDSARAPISGPSGLQGRAAGGRRPRREYVARGDFAHRARLDRQSASRPARSRGSGPRRDDRRPVALARRAARPPPRRGAFGDRRADCVAASREWLGGRGRGLLLDLGRARLDRRPGLRTVQTGPAGHRGQIRRPGQPGDASRSRSKESACLPRGGRPRVGPGGGGAFARGG